MSGLVSVTPALFDPQGHVHRLQTANSGFESLSSARQIVDGSTSFIPIDEAREVFQASPLPLLGRTPPRFP